MDPATAMIIYSAISSGAKAGSDYLSSKRNAKEKKRETRASVLHESLQRSAEDEAHRLKENRRLSKRKSQSMQDTADLVRRAFDI